MTSGPVRLDCRAGLDEHLASIVEHVRAGGVIAYPTETVYGLGGACTPEAVERVRALKSREADKPLLALVESAATVEGLRWTEEARLLAEIFWPGSVTLVMADPDALFPLGVRDPARGTVAVRVSPHPVVTALLSHLGKPLTSTSLNRPGEPPALAGDEAERVVRGLGGDDVWIVDGGTLPPSSPSTVVDCTGPRPVVLRGGAIPVQRLRCAIPEIDDLSQ